MSELDTLTDEQRSSLAELQTITQGDLETHIALLQSVNWDLQVRSLLLASWPSLTFPPAGGTASNIRWR